jgi:hypothetical protein
MHGDNLFGADFAGKLKRFADRHVADDAAPTTEEVVFVNRQESGVNGAVEQPRRR